MYSGTLDTKAASSDLGAELEVPVSRVHEQSLESCGPISAKAK